MSDAAARSRDLGLMRSRKGAFSALAIPAIAAIFFWLVSIYDSGLRDPRYLDGWVLAGGMALQLYFHIATRIGMISARSALRWRTFHIFVGYIVIAAFISHSNFSLPETGFEWALWAGFVLVALSGVFGTYLSWSMKSKRLIEEGVTYEAIPKLRAELASEVRDVVTRSDQTAAATGLPAPPHDAWIKELYTDHLKVFFEERNTASRLGGHKNLNRLTDEINGLSRYVDGQGKQKLAEIKTLVMRKRDLDLARVYLGLSRGWLFVHVPVTYALVALTLLHILVVYSFSSSGW